MKIAFLLLTSYFLLLTPVNAQSVDLLWQGETYTPPFYQGKSLWSTESAITFVAMPQGFGNQANLNYKWTRNGTVLGSISGVGRNKLIYVDSILSKPQTIRVDIISSEEDILASASVSATPAKIVLGVYENNPLYGFMFHQKVPDTYQMKGEEVTFAAFPYFFNTTLRANSSLAYEWRTNTGGLETRDSVTYRVPDNASGSSQVSLHVTNKNEITQDVRQGFLVEF